MDSTNTSRSIDTAAADGMELKPNGGQSPDGDADIVTLELTKQEAMALVQLIDAAVRARGWKRPRPD